MSGYRKRLGCWVLYAVLTPIAGTAAAGFVAPQDTTAVLSDLVTRKPLLAVTAAGPRIIAVGQRGHVVLSDDGGRSWKQASVPVASDLVAVSFPTASQGWAVGHGGVVIHSSDGGATWHKQLAGQAALKLSVEYYAARSVAAADAKSLIEQEKRMLEEGATQPFLDVYFESDRSGFVVGTFNRIYRTEDGGKTWTPWMDRTENPDGLHFYGIRGKGDRVYLIGEQGRVWRLDRGAQRFVAAPTPYKGTLFGLVVGEAGDLLAFGMRGSLFRSADEGRSWDKVATSSPAGITGGTVLPDGAIALVNQAGGIEVSRDGGRRFDGVRPADPMSYFGVVALGRERIGLVGAEGIRIEALGSSAHANPQQSATRGE